MRTRICREGRLSWAAACAVLLAACLGACSEPRDLRTVHINLIDAEPLQYKDEEGSEFSPVNGLPLVRVHFEEISD